MVHCYKCGQLNPDEANFCVKCGATLIKHSKVLRETRYHRHGSGTGALIAGLIIIIIGFSFLISDVWNIHIPWWPLAIIAVGMWLLVRAVMRQRRNL
ncbi:MAG: hypothetical protein N3D85_04900 [Candidatus Bathyarchaeota archaeon]|nr:hypothetical protein [Candidatus Bathyarchaeota archaeon]